MKKAAKQLNGQAGRLGQLWHSPHEKAAFSLIELLVVMGIITLLLSMLVPLWGRVMERARQIMCQSNLRHIGITTQLYTLENKEQFPEFIYSFTPGASGTIVILIVPKRAAKDGWDAYDNKLVLCARDNSPSVMPVLNDDGTLVWKPTSYGFNIEVDIFDVPSDTIKRPNNLVLFYDGVMGRSTEFTDIGSGKFQGHFTGTDDYVQRTLRRRHKMRPDSSNVLFADYHVEARETISSDMVQIQSPLNALPGGGNGNSSGSGNGNSNGNGGGGGNGKGKGP